MMGQSGSPVSEVHFENCEISPDRLLGGEEGVGFKTAMKALNKQRIHLSALSTGPAMRMLDDAAKYSMERKQFGNPISDFQLIQAMIADSHVDVAAARTLILDTARKRDEGVDITLEASMCKYFATEMCGRIADRAVQIFGGSGYVAVLGLGLRGLGVPPLWHADRAWPRRQRAPFATPRNTSSYGPPPRVRSVYGAAQQDRHVQ